jgi:hypothetical protein
LASLTSPNIPVQKQGSECFYFSFPSDENFPQKKTSPATTKFFNCEILLVLSPATYLRNIQQNSYDKNNGEGIQLQKCGMITLGYATPLRNFSQKN